ncbi:hypothetical protein STAS_20726 [Striga asiatica]|uniref:Uncharacterized protein n=1 Tax=Striga asiatica TaxID=4170 RepID=A0A5A7QFZ2_STRAF|nr:hypothetical protein STAS_20726 [Striga asiatica]
MKHCAIKQNSFGGRSVDKRETVVCPKPRRLSLAQATVDPFLARPLRRHMSHQQEDCDSRAGNELLDIILTKGNNGNSEQPQMASSPPFFSGSPPGRVSNPLIQDVRFVDNNYFLVGPTAQSPSSKRKGSCVARPSFGKNPAVRVEGFDCLNRDRRNCTIPTFA